MYEKSQQQGWREALAEFENRKDFESNAQNIHTPFKLCDEIVSKLDHKIGIFDKDFLVLNISFLEVLIYDFSVPRDRIYFVTDCVQKAIIVKKHKRYQGVNVEVVKFNKEGIKKMTPFKGKKFDVIVGNPPYQAPVDGDYSLWARFVFGGMEALKDDGFLLMVTPQGFLSPTADIRKGSVSILRDVMAKNNTLYIDVSSDIAEHFKSIGSTFAYYIVQKSNNVGQTIIRTDAGTVTVDLSDVRYLPKGRVTEKTISIFSKVADKSDKFMEWTRKPVRGEDKLFSDTRSMSTPYCIVNGNSNNSNFWWAKDKTEDYDSIKVIVPYNGTELKFVFDDGNIGYGNSSVYPVSDGDKLECVESYLTSKLVRFLLPMVGEKYTQYNEPAYLRTLPKLDFTRKWTEQQLYKHFDLTKKEIVYIEAIV